MSEAYVATAKQREAVHTVLVTLGYTGNTDLYLVFQE